MIFGVDYYPEHWDKAEWKHQAALMKEGGFNTVRIGEFAWKLFERQEGEFDFSLMDEAIQILSDNGIKIIMGTPTAAPPKWLVNKYDILQRDKYGRVKGWGSRRACCANNPVYIEKSKIIAEKMAEHYKDNQNIIAWQIDNEFGCHGSTMCYCEHCRREFGNWLKKRYSSIDSLNKKWGTAFWSLDFDSFEDIILPAYNACENPHGDTWSHNPSLDLEFRRFSSDSWVNYQKMQIDIIKTHTSAPVTHNLMGHFSDINAYDLSSALDFVSWDNYPDTQWGDSEYEYVSMAHEIMYGAKDKNFVVMEEQAGPAGWDVMGATPRPNQLRLWTYHAIAHGAKGIVYFRFRTALFGMEQYWFGVLDHDGIPRRRFFELQKTGKEMQALENYITNSKNKYDALIVKSYDNAWGHQIKSHKAGFSYENLLYSYYKANADLNITTAVSCRNLQKYKSVYMPAYNIIDENDVKEAKEYVRNGGVLVLTFRSGTRDKYNCVMPITPPGVFAEMAGIEVEEFDALRREVIIDGEVSGKARLWCDIIKPVTAKTICSYGSEYYKGRSAVTVNQYGKGKVYYIGCDLDDHAMKKLVQLISEAAGIDTISAPAGVEIIKRSSSAGDYIMILNHNEHEVTVDISGISLIDGKEFNGRIEGYGVQMLR